MASSHQKAALRKGIEVAERYRIVDLLGVGGVGAVYEAEHVGLGRRVALKILLPKYLENERMLSRFLQEARAAAGIGHPGIVEVYDVGRDDEMVYIAMEYLDGEELQTRITREHPLDEAFVLRIALELADAVSAAHEHGIIHRDLKPQNIYLANKRNQRDAVKVLDFGLAKLTRSDEEDSLITRSGEVFGTPMYMAPEHLRSAKDVDGRADIYAIGAILYQTLTGRTPFEASTFADLVIKVTSESPKSLSLVRPELSLKLVGLIEKAMSKDREDRFESAAELRAALSECQHDEEPEPPSQLADSKRDVSEDDHEGDGEPEEDDAGVGSREEGEVEASTPASPRAGLPPMGWVVSAIVLVGLLVGGGVIWNFLGVGASNPDDIGRSSRAPLGDSKNGMASLSTTPTSEESTSSIELSVEATPLSAKVFVDRAVAPRNPFTLRFPRDGMAHSVRVEAAGYETLEQMVIFDQNRRVEVELTKIPVHVDVPRSLQGTTPTQKREATRTTTGPRQGQPNVFPEDEDPWGE